jgi:hypothetical protein
MTLFQTLSLLFLGTLLASEIVGVLRGRGPRRFRLLRGCVWLAAGIAIAVPSLVQDVAAVLGIGRGADIVLYVLVFAFLAATFYLYGKLMRQQQQITQLVRTLALREAQQTRDPNENSGTM